MTGCLSCYLPTTQSRDLWDQKKLTDLDLFAIDHAMKVLRSAFKYFALFVLGLVTCAFVGIGAITYYAIDYLTQRSTELKTPEASTTNELIPESSNELIPESSKENFRNAFNASRSFLETSAQLSNLLQQLEKVSMPALCPSLCEASAMDKEQLKIDRVAYLERYLRSEGTRALQDPEFRLLIGDIERIYHVMKPAQKIMTKIDLLKAQQERPEGASTTDKLFIAAEIQGTLLSELYGFVKHIEQLQAEESKVKLVRDLHRACQKGTPVQHLIRQCESVLAQGSSW